MPLADERYTGNGMIFPSTPCNGSKDFHAAREACTLALISAGVCAVSLTAAADVDVENEEEEEDNPEDIEGRGGGGGGS
jgi:hypothetical protein